MNRVDEPPAGSASEDPGDLPTSAPQLPSRRRWLRVVGQQVALILVAIVLLGACRVVFLYALLGRKDVVVRSTQPDGNLVVEVYSQSFWGTCWSVHARPAGAWRWRDVGPTWCEGDHGYLPFRNGRLRIAWYPKRGIVTTFEADPDKTIETARFLSAYRYSPDGRTIELIPLVAATAADNQTQAPSRVIEGDSSRDLDPDDAKIRRILSLPTRVPPTPWPR